jgi:hypothetical protein
MYDLRTIWELELEREGKEWMNRTRQLVAFFKGGFFLFVLMPYE